MTTHKQIHLKHRNLEADIDELIAPLILEIWKAGIETMMSCQESDKKIWIEFPDVREAEKFLTIVGGVYETRWGSLYNRLTDEWFPENNNYKFWEARCWEYQVHVQDASIDDGKRVCVPLFYFSQSIRFPKSDLLKVAARVCEHNIRKKQRSQKVPRTKLREQRR